MAKTAEKTSGHSNGRVSNARTAVRHALRPAKTAATEPTAEEKWAAYSRALVITAHPDDAEFMAGGTMAKLAGMGLEVTLAVATSGDKGTRDADLRPQELAAMREVEQRNAASVLGLHDVVFLGYPDGFLEEGPELRGHVVRLIRELRPDIVITWDGFRAGFNHTDHRVVGRVVRDALFPAAHDPHYYPEHRRAGAGPWRTAEALLAATEEALREEVGAENFFLFGLDAAEVQELKTRGYQPWRYSEENPQLREVLDQLDAGVFSRGDRELFRPLVEHLRQRDDYLLLADYQAYVDAQDRVAAAFRDRKRWTEMAILNVARMGKFSSDRSIRDYCRDIWKTGALD